MDSYVFSSWIKFLLFVIPLWWSGTIITRFLVEEKRPELLYLLGLFGGSSIYIFLLNSFSFILKPHISEYVSFGVVVFLGLLILMFGKLQPLSPIKGKPLFLFIVSLAFLAVSLFWIVGKTAFGGDVEIFYAIAKTFNRGNFPMVTPWQPDLPLAYHYGPSILIGAIDNFAKLRLDFIQLGLSFLFLLCFIQSLIWFWKRHENFSSLLIYSIIPAMTLVTVGVIMLVQPELPFKLHQYSSVSNFLNNSQNLPTAHQSYETYGGAIVDINGHVYFFHHLVGLVITWWLFVLCLSLRRKRFIFNILAIVSALLSLALVNEALLIASVFFVAALILFFVLKQKSFKKDIRVLIPIAVIFTLVVCFQGGVLTGTILSRNIELEKSAVIVPKAGDYPEGQAYVDNVRGYHAGQQSTHVFKVRDNWFNATWYQLGISWLMGVFLLLIILLWKHIDTKKKIALLFLFSLSISSIFAFNIIVPRYIAANGNRFLSTGFQFLGLGISTALVFLLELLIKKKRKLLALILGIAIIWLIIPSVLPAILRFQTLARNENKLLPKQTVVSDSIHWLTKNTEISDRALNILGNAPFSANDTLSSGGILTPTFNQKFRAYTFEVSPDYIDMVTTLNPELLIRFGINYLVISSGAFDVLPDIRKEQIINPHFFRFKFESDASGKERWERVYKVRDTYLAEAENLPTTIEEMIKLIPKDKKVYIDDWFNTYPWNSMRKAIIFALIDYKPVLQWGPGSYLNVETFITTTAKEKKVKIDYLVLFKDTDYKKVCNCDAGIIWRGVNDNLLLYKISDNSTFITN